MRDIFVTIAVFVGVALTFYNPFFGVLTWHWLGLMNPHMLCWGFAYGFPFASLVAGSTLISLLANKNEPKQIPWAPITIVLALFWFWMLVTTFFALNPDAAWQQWDKVWKVQLFVFLTLMMLTSRARIDALIWVMVISLGFYGVKGGIFTILTGGAYHVYGPAASFIGGNNEIGMALIMTVPLFRYIQLQARAAWLKYSMTAAMALTFVAILGTQSRGAFVGLVAMVLYLLAKSRKKAVIGFLLILLLPFAFMLMPESWYERMETIKTYEEDASAMGRIQAWTFAFNLAVARPIVGGGFETFQAWVYRIYAPGIDASRDVHSIYFEVLGEHGFVGLGLFLLLGYLSLRTARSIVRQTKTDERLSWMRDLASMIHVSLVGYAVSGAFLGLAYFDFYYGLVAVLAALQTLHWRESREAALSATPSLPTRDAITEGSTAAASSQPEVVFYQRNPFEIKKWLRAL